MCVMLVVCRICQYMTLISASCFPAKAPHLPLSSAESPASFLSFILLPPFRLGEWCNSLRMCCVFYCITSPSMFLPNPIMVQLKESLISATETYLMYNLCGPGRPILCYVEVLSSLFLVQMAAFSFLVSQPKMIALVLSSQHQASLRWSRFRLSWVLCERLVFLWSAVR